MIWFNCVCVKTESILRRCDATGSVLSSVSLEAQTNMQSPLTQLFSYSSVGLKQRCRHSPLFNSIFGGIIEIIHGSSLFGLDSTACERMRKASCAPTWWHLEQDHSYSLSLSASLYPSQLLSPHLSCSHIYINTEREGKKWLVHV